jgi:6-pyruvoyltetrahydropterin/6-carboxytetrahydropterin synthase
MTFDVGVVAQFEATHHLVGDFGPASEPHEHTYRVEAEASGDELRADGTLFDITRLQGALGEVVRELAGADLNKHPELKALNPTAEIVARFVCVRLAAALRGEGPDRLRTRVWESPEAYAGYSADLG